MIKIKVSDDFTMTPGARYKSDGDFSGELFRESILEAKYIEARDEGVKLFVDLDDGYGYAQSFLEEAFGGLAREHGARSVEDILIIKSDDTPIYIEKIKQCISDTLTKAKR